MVIIQRMTENQIEEYNIDAGNADIIYGLEENGILRGFISADIDGDVLFINKLDDEKLSLTEVDGLMRAILNQAINMGIKKARVTALYESIFEPLKFFTENRQCDIKSFFEMGCSHE
ncbi:MAG: hypothetical protein N4A40_16800 [Tissierellales bacterium]|jgi:hypothetical protein|nr:hypothetical protein [Tissierellales bacterium]